MMLCAVISVKQSARVHGVDPPTWIIREAELQASHLHRPDDVTTHHVLRTGYIRVCVPLTMVQERMELGV